MNINADGPTQFIEEIPYTSNYEVEIDQQTGGSYCVLTDEIGDIINDVTVSVTCDSNTYGFEMLITGLEPDIVTLENVASIT